jgi:O-antigen ligase
MERPRNAIAIRNVLALAGLTGVVGYAAFQWGGVVRSTRYECLLGLGLVVLVRGFGRAPGRVLGWALALLPAYVLLQCVPLPLAVVRALSPARGRMLDALGPVGAKTSFASLSVFPAGTFQQFLLICGYVAVFLLVRELMWSFADRPWLVAAPVVMVAALEAALGLAQYFGGAGDSVGQGTYANRDHFAGFLEMALPFAVMYPVAVFRRMQSQKRQSMGPAVKGAAVGAVALLILLGIVFSFSRGGFLAALGAMLMMGALGVGSRKRPWVAFGGVAALVLAGFVFLPPEKLIARFAIDELKAEDRPELWTETLRLVREYPLVGCGLGGFGSVFVSADLSRPLATDDYAHNDYLQLLLELGAIGFILAALPAAYVVRRAARAASEAAGDSRYLGLASMGALAAIAIHSFTDFNLHIPANAMLLAWIGGLAAGAEFLARRPDGGKQVVVREYIDLRPVRM